jgi:hypothetical protein
MLTKRRGTHLRSRSIVGTVWNVKEVTVVLCDDYGDAPHQRTCFRERTRRRMRIPCGPLHLLCIRLDTCMTITWTVQWRVLAQPRPTTITRGSEYKYVARHLHALIPCYHHQIWLAFHMYHSNPSKPRTMNSSGKTNRMTSGHIAHDHHPLRLQAHSKVQRVHEGP